MPAVVLEDESLRDGLQFEDLVLPFSHKRRLFDMLRAAGVARIQVGSFVNPKVVPQMADTDQLVRELGGVEDVLVTGLVLHDKGLQRAVSAGLNHISLSVSVSDTHSRKNVRKSAAEALELALDLIVQARAANITVRAGAQCAFGCVYEGAVAEAAVVEALARMAQAGATELNLADTTGMANPRQIKQLVGVVAAIVPEAALSLHLHDTRGLGIANMVAGYEAGGSIFDTSVGGLGGCPFVKGAAGNVATEDAVNLFESMGVATGIDIERLCAVTTLFESLLGRRLPGRMNRVLAAHAIR